MPLPHATPHRQHDLRDALTIARFPAPVPARGANGRWEPLFPLHLWHLASLDAPTVAVVWSLGFAWVAGIRLAAWIPALLALTTWSVYIGDRLLDARAGNRSNLRERHLFHWRHRGVLMPLAVAAALGAVAIILTLMPAVLREHDSVLAAAAFAYFSGVHSRRPRPVWLRPLLSKEFLVGVIFTTGCALPALSQSSVSRRPLLHLAPLLLCLAFFALLAWLNCCAIESWESSPQRSPMVRRMAWMLSAAGIALAIGLAPEQIRAASLLAAGAASSLLLALLDGRRHLYAQVTLRAAADLVLLVPLLLLMP